MSASQAMTISARSTKRTGTSPAAANAALSIADPRDPLIIYSDSENGINRFNRHTMQSETISVWPVDASGHPASELEHRFNWTSPLMMSPHNPDTLYWGAERLFKTTDDGKSWTAVSGDLTRNDKSKQIASGGPITKDITSVEYYDTIFAIAESPLEKGHLWVGTDDGLVQFSSDDGAHWTNVTPPGMPEWGTVAMIEPSHFDEGTAYVAVDRHKLDDNHPYIFKTTDGGKTWTQLGTADTGRRCRARSARRHGQSRPALCRDGNRRLRFLRSRRRLADPAAQPAAFRPCTISS